MRRKLLLPIALITLGSSPAHASDTTGPAGGCWNPNGPGRGFWTTASDSTGAPKAALRCVLPDDPPDSRFWFVDSSGSWSVPVEVVDGTGCVHVAKGSGTGLWLSDGGPALRSTWHDVAAGTDAGCETLTTLSWQAAVLHGEIELPPGTSGSCVARVVGCGGGACVGDDGRFRFGVEPGECSVELSAHDGVHTWRGGTVEVSARSGEDVALALHLSSDPVSGLGVVAAPHRAGFIVVGLTAASPARAAGIRAGDIVTQIDGTSVQGVPARVFEGLSQGPVRSRAEVTVLREGGTVTIAVRRAPIDASFSGVSAGLRVQRRGEGHIVVELAPGGPAELAGIVLGDDIRRVDGLPTARITVGQLVTHLRGGAEPTTELTVVRGSETLVIRVERTRLQ